MCSASVDGTVWAIPESVQSLRYSNVNTFAESGSVVRLWAVSLFPFLFFDAAGKYTR